jgi:hypothetical protein
MIKRNRIMSHSYSYIYPDIQMMTLTDCSKSRAYHDDNDNNKSVSDYMMKAFEYLFKGLFAE